MLPMLQPPGMTVMQRQRIWSANHLTPREALDLMGEEAAWRLTVREGLRLCAATHWTTASFSNSSDFTAVANTTSETSLLTGPDQPSFPAFTFDPQQNGKGKAFSIQASGVFSTTGTPTMTWKLRIHTTQGVAVGGTVMGASDAITAVNNSANAHWTISGLYHVYTAGLGTGASTASGKSDIVSGVGYAAPYTYRIPNSATWTFTFDAGQAQYINPTLTWSAADPSNTALMKDLLVVTWR